MRINNTIKIFLKPNLFFLFVGILLCSCGTFKKGSDRKGKNSSPKPKTEKTTNTKHQIILEKYSGILSVSKSDIENIQLYTLIDEWYGVPYKYGGKDKKGVDCSNFVSVLFENVFHKKIFAPSYALYEMCEVIEPLNLKEGDLLFFKIEKEKISHVGIYLQNGKFVHATTKKGILINDINEPYYKKYFFSGGRIK